jgi:tetratricopeptide (TPR) repeat protein
LVTFLTIKLCSAGELTVGLAQDYYRQGLSNERNHQFFEAKVFFQKALLLDPDIPDREIIRKKISAIEAKENSAPVNVEAPLVEAKSISEPEAKKPKDFVTYYSGYEPFLQDCFTPLCEKIIFNNFGISYAEEQNFKKAEGMFKESLKIDSYFKPAQINLEILDDMR